MNTKRKKRRVPTPVTPRPPLVTRKVEPEPMVYTPLTSLSATNHFQNHKPPWDELSRDIVDAYRKQIQDSALGLRQS